jgi:hypothetical protein
VKSKVYPVGDFAKPSAFEAPAPLPPQTQPLSDTPDEHGEVAAPRHTVQQPSANGCQLGTEKLDTVTEPTANSVQDASGVNRERDSDHEPGQWCDELGEFVDTLNRERITELGEFTTAAPSTRMPPPRAARQAADTWARTGAKDGPKVRGMFPDGFTSPDDLDAFDQYDRVESVEAWAD